MLEEKTFKILNFTEIPERLSEGLFEEYQPDIYIPYSLGINLGNDTDLELWIRKNYPELEGKQFLIYTDY